MSKVNPERKVGIVTFSSEVQIIGDGTNIPSIVAGDKLLNYDVILENGIKCAETVMTKPIKETKKALETKLMAIEESGPTALGPGIFSAIALAGEGAPGSLVIVCTDGLANVGLGNFDDSRSELES